MIVTAAVALVGSLLVSSSSAKPIFTPTHTLATRSRVSNSLKHYELANCYSALTLPSDTSTFVSTSGVADLASCNDYCNNEETAFDNNFSIWLGASASGDNCYCTNSSPELLTGNGRTNIIDCPSDYANSISIYTSYSRSSPSATGTYDGCWTGYSLATANNTFPYTGSFSTAYACLEYCYVNYPAYSGVLYIPETINENFTNCGCGPVSGSGSEASCAATGSYPTFEFFIRPAAAQASQLSKRRKVSNAIQRVIQSRQVKVSRDESGEARLELGKKDHVAGVNPFIPPWAVKPNSVEES